MNTAYAIVIVCIIILVMNLSLWLATKLSVKGYFVGSLLGIESTIPDMIIGAVGALGLAALYGAIDGSRVGLGKASVVYNAA